MCGIQLMNLGLGRITKIGSAAAGEKDLVVPSPDDPD
jgi:hypothetical protein